jgi:DNA-binding CsgD family transcriptional regulator
LTATLSSYLSNTKASRTARSEDVSRPEDARRLPSAPDDAIVAPGRVLALFAAKDLEDLIDTAFDIIRAAVACDFASAFYRSGGDGLLKARDSRGRQHGAPLMRRYVELNPAIPLVAANRGVKVLGTRMGLPRSNRELRRTAFYREIMQPLGWRHSVALCFWGDPPAEMPVFVVSADRSEDQSDFSDHEVAALTGLHPFLDCAVNRLHERKAAESMRDGIAIVADDGTRGVVILDRNFLLVQANPMARQLSAVWMDEAPTPDHGAPGAWRLPPILQAACRHLHHEWQSLVHANPDTTGIRRQRRVEHPDVAGLTASITMVCPNTAGLAEPTFVLELYRRVHGLALDTPDRSAPVLQKMTAAERTVALALADGLSNQDIADRLGKTVDAVKFLLHRIYQRTGVPNRTALVAVLRSRASGHATINGNDA